MRIDRYLNIGDKLKNIRKQKGLKQFEVADLTNIARSTYANYENNRRTPDIPTLLNICGILEISINDLIGGDTSNSTVGKNISKHDEMSILIGKELLPIVEKFLIEVKKLLKEGVDLIEWN